MTRKYDNQRNGRARGDAFYKTNQNLNKNASGHLTAVMNFIIEQDKFGKAHYR